MGTTRVQGTDPKQDRHPHSWGSRRLQKKKAWDWSREGRWNVLGPDVGGRGSERDRPGSSPYLTCKGRRKDPEDAYRQVRSLPWPCPTHTPPLEAGILLLSTPQDPQDAATSSCLHSTSLFKSQGSREKNALHGRVRFLFLPEDVALSCVNGSTSRRRFFPYTYA